MKNQVLLKHCSMEKRAWLRIIDGLLIVIVLTACAGDRYHQQMNNVKTHVERFYSHLESHRVNQAVSDNEQIEVIALRAEERLLRRVGQMDQGEKMQEWNIIRTAKETAAENWFALARYFLEVKQYDKARGTYRRVVETYQGSPYHSYVDRAKMGLRDVDAILDPPILPVTPEK